MQPIQAKGQWVYPHLPMYMLRAMRLKALEHYIDKRRHSIAATIQGRQKLAEGRKTRDWQKTSLPSPLVAAEIRLYMIGEGRG